MRVIDVNMVASEIVAVLEKHQVPVGYLEEVLDKVEETVLYFAPIKLGPVGREMENGGHHFCAAKRRGFGDDCSCQAQQGSGTP